MRFVLTLALLFSVTAHAQDINAADVVRQARAERARARCMLRAAGRSERLAGRYRRARSDSARARLAEELDAVDAARQTCLHAVDAEYNTGSGTIGVPPAPRVSGPRHVVVQTRIISSPTNDIPELRRMWARAAGRLRHCVERALNIDPTPFEGFAVNYTIAADGSVDALEGVPPRLEACFAFLLRQPHPEQGYGMQVRVLVRARLEEPASPPRDVTAVDFPNRRTF